MNLLLPVVAFKVAPVAIVQLPAILPLFQSALPDNTAAVPVKVPAARSRLVEAIAPLKAALALTRLVPVPVKLVPALKVDPPANCSVPVAASS